MADTDPTVRQAIADAIDESRRRALPGRAGTRTTAAVLGLTWLPGDLVLDAATGLLATVRAATRGLGPLEHGARPILERYALELVDGRAVMRELRELLPAPDEARLAAGLEPNAGGV